MSERMTGADFERLGDATPVVDPDKACRPQTVAYAQALYAEARRARESEATKIEETKLLHEELRLANALVAALEADKAALLEVLRAAEDFLGTAVMGNSWGLIDKTADAFREETLAKVRAALLERGGP